MVKQFYGAWGDHDPNRAALMHARARRGDRVTRVSRSVEGSRRVNKAKAAIRRLDQPYDHVADLMRDYALTEGKVRTLIAKVAREKI